MADTTTTAPAAAAAPTSEGSWKRIFTRTLPHEQRALLGTILFFALIVLVGWQAANEGHRMSTFTTQYDARSIQRGAGLFNDNCRPCHGPNGEGIPGVAPALNNPDLFGGARAQQLGFSGSLKDFVELTISAGRPARSGDWPNPMPTWSQEFGGPLRPDQVRDLTNFVLNWGCQYDPNCVGDEAIVLTQPPPATEQPGEAAFEVVCPEGGECVPFDQLPEGDAARGEALFNGAQPAPDGQALGCTACHSLTGTAGVGPSLQGISQRVPPDYPSVQEYIYTSITHPDAYVREGFTDIMPKTFGQRLDAQSLADLVAFLSGQ